MSVAVGRVRIALSSESGSKFIDLLRSFAFAQNSEASHVAA